MRHSIGRILTVVTILLLTCSISEAQTVRRVIKKLQTQPVGTASPPADDNKTTQGTTAKKMLVYECLNADITSNPSILDARVEAMNQSGHLSSIEKKIFSEINFKPDPDSINRTQIDTAFGKEHNIYVSLRYIIGAGQFENSVCPKTALVLMQMFPAPPQYSTSPNAPEVARSNQTDARITYAPLISPPQNESCVYKIKLFMSPMLASNEHFADSDKMMVVPFTVCSENIADPTPVTVVFTFKKIPKNEANFSIQRKEKGADNWSEIQMKEF